MRQVKVFPLLQGKSPEILAEELNTWLRKKDAPESDVYITMVYPDMRGGFIVVFEQKDKRP